HVHREWRTGDGMVGPEGSASALSSRCHLGRFYLRHEICSRSDLSMTDHAQRVGEARDSASTARRAAMAVLADAHADEIEQGLQAVVRPVDYVELRAVE